MMTFVFDYEEILGSGVDAITYLYPETIDFVAQALEEEEIILLADYAHRFIYNPCISSGSAVKLFNRRLYF